MIAGLGQSGADVCEAPADAFQRSVGQRAQEFVPTQSDDGLVRAQVCTHRADDAAQQSVTGLMTQVVIRHLQPVNVHVGHDELTRPPTGTVDQTLQLGQARSPLPRARQYVDGRRLTRSRSLSAVLGGLLAVLGGKLAVMGRLGALSRRAGAVMSGSPTVARRLQQDLRAGGWAVRSIVRRLTGCSPISLVCLAVAHVGGPVAVRRGQIPLLRPGLAKPSRLQALTRAFLTCQRGLLPGVTAAEVPVLPMPAGQLEIAVDLISVGGALVTVGGFLIAVRSGLIPVRPVWSLSAFV